MGKLSFTYRGMPERDRTVRKRVHEIITAAGKHNVSSWRLAKFLGVGKDTLHRLWAGLAVRRKTVLRVERAIRSRCSYDDWLLDLAVIQKRAAARRVAHINGHTPRAAATDLAASYRRRNRSEWAMKQGKRAAALAAADAFLADKPKLPPHRGM